MGLFTGPLNPDCGLVDEKTLFCISCLFELQNNCALVHIQGDILTFAPNITPLPTNVVIDETNMVVVDFDCGHRLFFSFLFYSLHFVYNVSESCCPLFSILTSFSLSTVFITISLFSYFLRIFFIFTIPHL